MTEGIYTARRSRLAGGSIVALAFAACAAIAGGCASTGESAGVDALVADVGQYPAPPSAVVRPKLGVPPMQVSGSGNAFGFDVSSSEQIEENAADQLTTLWQKSRRFRMIERAQLNQLLREQDLEGIVRADEAAMLGEVRGLDYLCIGKVTNFEVRVDTKSSGMGVGGGGRWTDKLLGSRDPLGGFQGGFDRKNSTITITCGVDLRIVDPSTGEIAVAETSTINRELKADSLGVDLDLFRTEADADIQINEDDAGKLLRLALDQTIRQMLPEVDELLIRKWDEEDVEEDDA